MKKNQRSFTIIELLAAVTVLSIILLLTAQITGMVNKAYGEGMGRVDNFTKSRAMMDLIADDLRNAVLRPDLPAFQVGAYSAGTGYAAGTATNAFYTLLPSITTNAVPRNLSLVYYSVEATNSTDKIALWRSDSSGSWNNNSLQAFQGNLSDPLGNGNLQKREMAPGVVGFQFLFRQLDGTVSLAYPGYSTNNPVTSIGVAIAVVGSKSLDHLTSNQIGGLTNAFTISITSFTGSSAKAYWDSTAFATIFPSSGGSYPKDLGANLRTFERWISCPAF